MGEVEHEAGKIGGENFRPVGGLERGGLRLVPQPIADAGLGAAGAAAPLVGGGARDPHGLEPGEPHVGLVARHPREPAIDHDAHAFDRERGLRDRGREHDLAPAGRRRARSPGPARRRRARHRAARYRSRDRRRARASSVSVRRISAAPGRKTKQRTGLGAQRARDGIGDLPFDRDARVAPEIAGLDREGAAGALDHRRVAEELADARAVERRRHDQELEVLAQALLHVARQRQAEVGIERALVELVEQHGGDALERGIVEDQAREHALGHDLDARRAPRLWSRSARGSRRSRRPLRPASPPCARPRRARRAGAARARGASCPCAQGSAREHERHPRGLAGAGRGDQHRGVCRAQSARSAPAAPDRWEAARAMAFIAATLHARSAVREGARRDVHSAAESVAKSPFKC